MLTSVDFTGSSTTRSRPAKGGQSQARNKTAKELASEWKVQEAERATRFKPRPACLLSDEQLAHAKVVFNNIDKDGSGYIDMDELLAWFKSCGKQVTRDQLKELLFDYDYSQDEQIDLREFLNVFVSATSPTTQRDEAVQSLKEVLDAFGDTGKQQIKKQSFIQLLNEQYELQVDSAFVDGLMKEAWFGSAKATQADLQDSLDEFLTLEELKQALHM